MCIHKHPISKYYGELINQKSRPKSNFAYEVNSIPWFVATFKFDDKRRSTLDLTSWYIWFMQNCFGIGIFVIWMQSNGKFKSNKCTYLFILTYVLKFCTVTQWWHGCNINLIFLTNIVIERQHKEKIPGWLWFQHRWGQDPFGFQEKRGVGWECDLPWPWSRIRQRCTPQWSLDHRAQCSYKNHSGRGQIGPGCHQQSSGNLALQLGCCYRFRTWNGQVYFKCMNYFVASRKKTVIVSGGSNYLVIDSNWIMHLLYYSFD